MSLDDRLRGAYRRQVEEVQRDLDTRPAAVPIRRNEMGTGLRLAGIAAALMLVAVGALAVTGLGEDTSGSIRTDAGDSAAVDEPAPSSTDEPTTTVPTTTPPTTTISTARPTTIPPSTAAPAASEGTGTSETVPTTAPSTSVGGEDSSTTVQTSEAPATTDSTAPIVSGGVASTVCPSRARAELERAATRYVGENRGWGRKDDLVDEQDGPYYFMAWEPNYELPVTVEIILDEPVLATDIRVFQDPFTPVSGTISIEVAGEAAAIELSGTDGWRVHNFAQPILVDRFTIGRDAVESNIMEVVLCVEQS